MKLVLTLRFQEPELQNGLSDLVVAIGARFCYEVMEVLLNKFQPGAIPNCIVVQTMANLAAANGSDLIT